MSLIALNIKNKFVDQQKIVSNDTVLEYLQNNKLNTHKDKFKYYPINFTNLNKVCENNILISKLVFDQSSSSFFINSLFNVLSFLTFKRKKNILH